jgi:hypothetical protein
LSREVLEEIKGRFSGFPIVISPYDVEKKEVKPLELAEVYKRKRPEP